MYLGGNGEKYRCIKLKKLFHIANISKTQYIQTDKRKPSAKKQTVQFFSSSNTYQSNERDNYD